MKSVADYRKFAEECMDMADRAPPEIRQALLKMAEAWLELALSSAQRINPDQSAPSSEKLQ